jgi:ketosteroid isomerase-like protein
MRGPTVTTANQDDTERAIDAFNLAFNRHDLAGVMAAMTDDCVFEDTSPPDGKAYHGQAEVRAAFAGFFDASPDARFEAEDCIILGEHAYVRWTYSWVGAEEGHVRGVDLLRLRDGKVAEKCSYVKG